LGDKPLLLHSIGQAKASGLFDAIAVSSDDEAILALAKEGGVDECVTRLPEHATDTAAKLPAIRHCVEEVERRRDCSFDLVVDLQPTSPLREAQDISAAVLLVEVLGAENVITGSIAKSSPYFSLVEERTNGTVGLSKPTDPPIVRRQDAPKCFDMNGSIYVWQRAALMKQEGLFLPTTRLYEMPEERSVDIDTELDFEFAEFLLRRASA